MVSYSLIFQKTAPLEQRHDCSCMIKGTLIALLKPSQHTLDIFLSFNLHETLTAAQFPFLSRSLTTAYIKWKFQVNFLLKLPNAF